MPPDDGVTPASETLSITAFRALTVPPSNLL
jgi:hypothetical protein